MPLAGGVDTLCGRTGGAMNGAVAYPREIFTEVFRETSWIDLLMRDIEIVGRTS
jgi:hypothetical protein